MCDDDDDDDDDDAIVVWLVSSWQASCSPSVFAVTRKWTIKMTVIVQLANLVLRHTHRQTPLRNNERRAGGQLRLYFNVRRLSRQPLYCCPEPFICFFFIYFTLLITLLEQLMWLSSACLSFVHVDVSLRVSDIRGAKALVFLNLTAWICDC